MIIIEALEAMQEPYRSKAIKNMRSWHMNVYTPNLSTALRNSFDWNESPEGYEYWNDYHNRLRILNL